MRNDVFLDEKFSKIALTVASSKNGSKHTMTKRKAKTTRIPPGMITLLLGSMTFSFILVRDAARDISSRRHVAKQAHFRQSVQTHEQIRQMDTKIRTWGCGMTDTPFIFVHIGKAGGGSTRARIAASSLNFTAPRGLWKGDKGSFYPVRDSEGQVVQKARFCNSRHRQFRPYPQISYEKTLICNASTPIGQALACPEPLSDPNNCNPDMHSDQAPVVYVGHNFFGSELHWLPPKYLARWWDQHWAATKTGQIKDKIAPLWRNLEPDQDSEVRGSNLWCPQYGWSRPMDRQLFRMETCQAELHPRIDRLANRLVRHKFKQRRFPVLASEESKNSGIDWNLHPSIMWSEVHASLPVIRVTQLRDPFSWLMSKFFWHGANTNCTCDDIDEAVGNVWEPEIEPQDLKHDEPGWLKHMCLLYIFYLCGEDCMVRFYSGESSLDDLEIQAAHNLRNSFAVVGLSNETDTFFDMINARVDYLDTSLNLHIKGGKHKSPVSDEAARCKHLYLEDEGFRFQLLAASPELAVADRLYKIGVEVNRFQLNELQQCDPESFVKKSHIFSQNDEIHDFFSKIYWAATL